MAVGLFVDPIFYKVGSGDFLNSFFSTVYVKLENYDWGSKYPFLMNHLYDGRVNRNKIKNLKIEIKNLRSELKKLSPKEIVWDFEDLDALPPWGKNISTEILDMSDYFITSDGKNLLDVIEKACDTCKEINKDLVVRSI